MKKLLFALSICATTLLASNANAAFVVNKNTTELASTVSSSDATEIAPANEAVTTESNAIAVAEGASSGKNHTVALILAILGVFIPLGLLRWYLGKDHALLQTLLVLPLGFLVVTWLASWIWQIIDLIRFVSGDLK